MSSSIDQRIVEMQFKNSEFEKGIKQSIKSLENLDKSLNLKNKDVNLKGATSSIEDLQRAGNSFALTRMAEQIDTISSKFTLLGRMGLEVMDRLASRVVDVGVNFAKSVSTSQISQGWDKYNNKMASVQTIMNSTGASVDEVNKTLDKLMWFSDETSFNFGEMTSSLATMTSSGGDMAKLIPMIEGIATATAFAGKGASEFSRVIYNLNQSYGQGYLSYMDWRSVELAGVGSKQLKQALMDAAVEAGTLKKASDGTYKTLKGTAVTVSNMSSTLSEKWATTTVMETAFGNFSSVIEEAYKLVQEGVYDTASEAIASLEGKYDEVSYRAAKAAQEAKSFAEAVSATQDAVSSGWMKTFEIIIGNKEESTKLWTDLANALWEVFASGAEARNELLQLWKDAGGRDDLIQGITDALTGLWNIFQKIKAEWKKTFPGLTVDKLLNISTAIKEIGAIFKQVTEDASEAVEEVEEKEEKHTKATLTVEPMIDMPDFEEELKKGSSGDAVKELQKQLTYLGYDVGPTGPDGIFGPKTLAALEKFQEEYNLTVDGLYDQEVHDKLYETVHAMEQAELQVGEFTNELKEGAKGDDVKKLQKQLMSLGYDLGPAGADGIFGPKTVAAMKQFQKDYNLTVDGIYNSDVHNKLKELLNPVEKKEDKTEEKENEETSKKSSTWALLAVAAFSALESPIDKLTRIFAGFFAIIKIGVKIFGFLVKVAAAVLHTLSPLINFILSVAAGVGDALVAFNKWISESGILEKALTGIKNILKPVREWISSVCDSILEFFGLNGTKSSLVNSFTSLLGLGGETTSVIDGILGLFGKKKSKDVEETTDEMKTFHDWWTKIKTTVESMPIWTTIKESFQKLKDAWNGIKPTLQEWKEKFKTALGEKFTNFLKSSSEKIPEILGKIGEGFNNFLGWLTPIISKLPDIVRKIKVHFKNLLDTFKASDQFAKLKQIWENIKNFFTSIWSWFTGLFSGGTKSTANSDLGSAEQRSEQLTKTVSVSEEIEEKAEELKGIWAKIKAKFVEIFGEIKTFFINTLTSIGDFFSNNWGWFALVGGLGLLVFVIVKIVKAINTFTTNLRVLKHGYEKKNPKDKLGDTFLKIAGSIIAICAAIYVLGKMPVDELKRGATVIAGIFGAFVILIAAGAVLEKLKMADGISKIGKAMFQIGIGVAALAVAIYLFGTMKPAVFAKGLMSLAGILLVFAGFFAIVKNVKIELKGFIQFAAAIVILTAVTYLLGTMKPKVFLQGLTGLAVIMGLMTVMMLVMGKFGSTDVKLKGFISFALCIAILARVAKSLGKMKTAQMIQGLVGLTVIMGLMAGMIFVLGKFSNGINMNSSLVMIAAFAGFIYVFAEAIKKVKDIDAKVIIAFSAGLAVALAALTAACLLISKFSSGSTGSMLKGALSLSLALGVIIITLGALLAGIGKLDELSGGVISDSIEKGANVLQKVGEGMEAFKGPLGIAVLGIIGLSAIMGMFPQFKGAAWRTLGNTAIISTCILVATAFLSAIVVLPGLINKWTSGNFESWLDDGAKILQKISDGIMVFKGPLGIALGAITLLSAVLAMFPMFKGAKIAGRIMANMVIITVAIDICVALLGALIALPGLINDWTKGDFEKWIDDGAKILKKIGDGLTVFAGPLGTFAFAIIVFSTVLALVPKFQGAALKILGNSFLIGLALEVAIAFLGAIVGLPGLIQAYGSEGNNLESNIEKGAEILQLIGEKLEVFNGPLGIAAGAMIGLGAALALCPSLAGTAPSILLNVGIIGVIIEVAIAFLGAIVGLPGLVQAWGSEGSNLESNIEKGAEILQLIGEKIEVFNGPLGIAAGAIIALAGIITAIPGGAAAVTAAAPKIALIEVIIGAIIDLGVLLAASLPALLSTIDGLDSMLGGDFEGSIEKGGDILGEVAKAIGKFFGGFKAGSIEIMNEALSDFSEVEIDEDNIAKATTCTQQIADLANSLGSLSVGEAIAKWINEGDTKFDDFCESMPGFVTAVNTAATDLQGLNVGTFDEDIKTAISAASQLASFLTALNTGTDENGNTYDIEENKNGLFTWFTSEGAAGSLIDQIPKLSGAIKTIHEDIADLSQTNMESDTETMRSVLEKLASFLTYLSSDEVTIPDKELLTGEYGKVSDFLGQIAALGTTIQTFNTDTADLDTAKFETIISKVSELATAFSSLTSSNGTGDISLAISSITSLFSGEGKDALTNDNFLKNLDASKIDAKLSTFVTDVTTSLATNSETLSSYTQSFNDAGSSLASSLTSGLSNNTDTSSVSGIADSCLNVLNTYTSQFTTIGHYWAVGLGNGIEHRKVFVVAKAAALAKATVKKIKELLDIESPSKVMYQIGEYFDMGLENGIADKSSSVVNASKSMASSVLDAAKGGLSTINSIISDSMDGDPVIRPVIDLSDVQSGARTINGMFAGSQTISTKAAYNNASATAASMVKAKTNQNGSENPTDSSSFSSKDSSVNLSGNNFYVRSEQDIHSLASEIASLTRQQQRGLGGSF